MRNQQPQFKLASIGWTAVLCAVLMFAISCSTTRLPVNDDDDPIGPYHPVIDPGSFDLVIYHIDFDDHGIEFKIRNEDVDTICPHVWVYIAIPIEEQFEHSIDDPLFPCVCIKCHQQSMCK